MKKTQPAPPRSAWAHSRIARFIAASVLAAYNSGARLPPICVTRQLDALNHHSTLCDPKIGGSRAESESPEEGLAGAEGQAASDDGCQRWPLPHLAGPRTEVADWTPPTPQDDLDARKSSPE